MLGAEEYEFNAQLLGRKLDVLTAVAPDADAAYRAGRRLASSEDVFALAGGFEEDECRALSAAAGEAGSVYFNIGCSSDRLRRKCDRHMFHVEASAGMYLDALVAWFVRAGFRRWFVVHQTTEEGVDRAARAKHAIEERHWGAAVAALHPVQANSAGLKEAVRALRMTDADVVLALLPSLAQLDMLEQIEGAGIDLPFAAFPEADTQTRDYIATARERAPVLGAGHRAASWEASLDAYGARELNARYYTHWGEPMDPSAWAAYQAIKILYETAINSGDLSVSRIVQHLEDKNTVFDVHKGIGVSFRPWDHQLRQPLYLIKVHKDEQERRRLAAIVGELPAIYMPRTDPIERLDQLGDSRARNSCRFS